MIGVVITIIVMIYVTGLMLPVSHTATISKQIKAPQEIIWEHVTSPQNFPQWREEVNRVEILSDSTETLRWTEFYEGQDALTFQEYSRSDSSLFVTDIISKDLPFSGRWTISLQKNGNTTIVTITEDGEIYSPIFRFFSRFVFGYESTMKQYLDDLKLAAR